MRRLMYSLPILLLMATAVLFTTSCSKKGDAGPAGQQGQKGDKGDKGDTGAGGSKGDPGTANVIYSDWLDVPFKPDTVHMAGGRIDTIGWYAGISAPKLSVSLLTSGEVKVYINLGTAADPVVAPLPYNEGNGIYIRYVAFKESLQLDANVNAGTYLNNAGAKVLQYRYILIPGGTAARKANAVDWNNYKAVKDYLGLKD
ncbi:collagen-like triple helix repeat-containing protein [Chitinophaga qingshengii]|uniref:Collagen-like protein n=1 Tax=Chitinophaga qingshengii TaxID=1569794 RepID=A0ABR7TMW1_9BACT|nr:collagen-like protein [Chitinophaga qingshengii]MBC9931820.1 collagen-like protein [Chitinophaga qingshengii]